MLQRRCIRGRPRTIKDSTLQQVARDLLGRELVRSVQRCRLCDGKNVGGITAGRVQYTSIPEEAITVIGERLCWVVANASSTSCTEGLNLSLLRTVFLAFPYTDNE